MPTQSEAVEKESMNPSAAQALAYIEMGLRPIPIPSRSKRPTLDGWPKLNIKREEVEQYFPRECNIGVILGDVSRGIADIDLDCIEAVLVARELLPRTAVFGRAGNPRSHYVYYSRYAQTKKFQDIDGKMLCELRANKSNEVSEEGLQTVFPDSVHESGERIEWDEESGDAEFADVKPEDLHRAVCRVACAAILIRLGWDSAAALAFVRAPDVKKLQLVPEPAVRKLTRWLGLEEPRRPRLQSVPNVDRDAIMKRARVYMSRVPGAVEGNGGHQQTWEGALNCIRGFDLTLSEGREILDEYNQRCDPPWSDKELDHKLDGIMNAHTAGKGWLLEDRRAPESPRSRPNGTSGRVNEPEEAGPESAAALGFPTVTVASIQDPGPVQWLVRDLWLDQGVGIVGGEPKSYKSFVAVQLAVCVASGKPMFRDHEVKRGRVLMFNAEDRPTMTRQRVAEMCRSLEIDIATLDLYLIDVPALRLDDLRQVQQLDDTLKALKPTLLILDPFRDLHGRDENDAQIVSGLLSPLRVMQREHGCAVMLVHHMAKQGETQRRAGQRLRGSSALHGWVDSALYLQWKDGKINVTPEHRAAPAIDAFAFTLEHAGDGAGNSLWLEKVRNDEADAAERDRLEVVDNKVLQLVAASNVPMTMRDIRGKCSMRGSTVDEAVRRLVRAGLFDEEPVTKGNGHVVPGFKTKGINDEK